MMQDVTTHPQASSRFRFYAELNDFLDRKRSGREFEAVFARPSSVKDTIEALGVPHTEVDLILVNGTPRGFDELLRGGERVSVYPVFERLDISKLNRLRPRPLRTMRFVLDVHLGQLARRLRLLGLDVVYRNDLEDEEIVRIAVAQRRTILTRASSSTGWWIAVTGCGRPIPMPRHVKSSRHSTCAAAVHRLPAVSSAMGFLPVPTPRTWEIAFLLR